MHALVSTLAGSYFILTFLTSLGVMQLCGARSGRRHLLLVNSGAAWLGWTLIAVGYGYFLLRAPYLEIGLAGKQLFFGFARGAAAAFATCVVLYYLRTRMRSSAAGRLATVLHDGRSLVRRHRAGKPPQWR